MATDTVEVREARATHGRAQIGGLALDEHQAEAILRSFQQADPAILNLVGLRTVIQIAEYFGLLGYDALVDRCRRELERERSLRSHTMMAC